MQRLFKLMLALVLCAATTSHGAPEWQPLQVSEGGFKVLMRTDPVYTKQDLETPAGRMTAYLYSSDRPVSYYAVGYSDYPLSLVIGEDPLKMFSGVRDTWVRRIQGRLVGTENKLRLAGGYPGLEFSAEGKAKGKDTFLQARLFLVDQRLYQVIAMGVKNQVPQGEINRFLNSFELVQTAGVSKLEIKPAGK
jgi:hypothetical protein